MDKRGVLSLLLGFGILIGSSALFAGLAALYSNEVEQCGPFIRNTEPKGTKQPEANVNTTNKGASSNRPVPGRMTVTAKPKKCPFCGSTEIKQYLFGLPTKEASKSGKYILGGCVISNNNPSWGCVNCHSNFYRPRPMRNDRRER